MRALTGQVQNEKLNSLSACFSNSLSLGLKVPERLVVDVLRVGEVDGSIDTNCNDARCNCSVRVLLHVPVHVGPRDVAQARGVGPGDVEEDLHEGDGDGDEQADLHGHEEHAEEGS